MSRKLLLSVVPVFLEFPVIHIQLLQIWYQPKNATGILGQCPFQIGDGGDRAQKFRECFGSTALDLHRKDRVSTWGCSTPSSALRNNSQQMQGHPLVWLRSRLELPRPRTQQPAGEELLWLPGQADLKPLLDKRCFKNSPSTSPEDVMITTLHYK